MTGHALSTNLQERYIPSLHWPRSRAPFISAIVTTQKYEGCLGSIASIFISFLNSVAGSINNCFARFSY